MAIIPVELAGREYEVRVGHGLLQSIATEAEPFLRKRHVCIVADINARANWGDAVSRSLELAGIEPRWFDVAPGEASKSWAALPVLQTGSWRKMSSAEITSLHWVAGSSVT